MSMFRRRLLIYQALMNKSGNIVYPGLIAAWSAKGKTNNDEDKAILKDLTGNGHDINLNGFAFSEMSGYGGYNVKHNFTYTSNNRCDKIERLGYKLTFINIKENLNLLFAFPNEMYSSIGCKIKVYVKGIPNGGELFFGDNKWIHANKDGIYEGNVVANNNGNVTIASLNCIGSTISVEFLPEYPDALVFDGVDDYGINENVPILTDFTVIAKREIFGNIAYSCAISKYKGDKNGAFNFDMPNYNGLNSAFSYGHQNYVEFPKNKISWMTPLNYNQQIIKKGPNVDGTNLSIGVLRGNKYFLKFAFYSAYLFDRSLDEQEIKAFIRKYIDPEYLLPSEILTPDCYYDFSKGSNDDVNRNTIKDYSGNGNDAVAHNFAWRGMSGYGGYNCYFSSNSGVNRYEGSFTNDKVHITKIIDEVNKNLINIYIINNFNIKISGITGNNLVRIGPPNVATLSLSNGTHKIDSSLFPKGYNYSIGILGDIGECDITIEFIPEYPGALVFDGTDDYVSLDAFDSGFKTMFMKFKPINTINAGYYDQIKKGESKYYFSVSGSSSDIAFSYRNTNGKTYINGILNTSILSKDVVNKTVCIGIVNENVTADNTTIPKIGDGTHFTPWFANMALYKFLGFKEALTEEQIQTVIKKYNLLDGVDEIEVN